MTEPQLQQPQCPKCGGTGITGLPDFPGDVRPVTMSVCECRTARLTAQQDWPVLSEEELSSISHHWWERAAHDIGDQDANESVLRLIATIRALQAQVSSLTEVANVGIDNDA